MIVSPTAPIIHQSAIRNFRSSILMSTPRELLDRLNSRHDMLIHKLDELNAEIEQSLAQFAKARTDAPQPLDTPANVTSVAETPSRRAA